MNAPKDDDYEIDYKSMFEQVNNLLNRQYELYDEYCNLLREISECADEVNIISKNVTRMNLLDQVAFLKTNVISAKLSKKLCEKYDYFSVEEKIKD